MDETENQFIRDNYGLVMYIAKRYSSTRIFDFDDILQEGLFALMKAYRTYDPSKNITFGTYAGVCIKNQIIMLFRTIDNKHNRFYIQSAYMDSPLIEGEDMTLHDICSSHVDMDYGLIKDELISHLMNYEHAPTVDTLKLCLQGYSEIEISKITNVKQTGINRRINKLKTRAKKYILS